MTLQDKIREVQRNRILGDLHPEGLLCTCGRILRETTKTNIDLDKFYGCVCGSSIEAIIKSEGDHSDEL